MAKFSEPPSASRLRGIRPEVTILSAGTAVWRLYFRGGRHPTFWDVLRSYGPSGSRFDHHLPPAKDQGRAILYGALHGPTCLAEVFQDTRLIDRTARDPWLVAFELDRDVPLLDLTGAWPTRAGASMALSSGPRPRAQRWSRVFYEAYPEIEGLYYPSSMYAHHPAVAFYERSTDAMPEAPLFHRLLTEPALLSVLKHVAFDVGYSLA